MNRFDLLITNKTIKEYKPMGWASRRAYSRRIDRALRYISPPDITFEDLFWILAALAMIAAVIIFPIRVLQWWFAG